MGILDSLASGVKALGSGIKAGVSGGDLAKGAGAMANIGKLVGMGGKAAAKSAITPAGQKSGEGTAAEILGALQKHQASNQDTEFYGHSKPIGPKTVANPSTVMPTKMDKHCKYTNIGGK